MTSHTVGEIAAISGVTVRTLHHYDEIGLLTASRRDTNGYRRYSADDVRRLQRILFYRELEFSLDEIAALLDEPVDEEEHLRRQSALLSTRIERLARIKKAVDQTLEARAMGVNLTPGEMLEVFGEDYAEQHEAYAAEAADRWGDTDAWAQSRQRTTTYTKDDWVRVKEEMDLSHAEFAAALRAGEPADSERAMDAAEAARRQIHDRFYDCSHEMHVNLGDMYVADPRFMKTYEDIAPGLAVYVRDAILANGVRHV